jgi:16S rRNA (adenine1518-N6/adenine1519-N6)-dimethyltransferase
MSVVRGLLDKYGLAPKKGFGQNFLVNAAIPERIAACSREFAPGDRPSGVLEIGPGVGALTQYLAREYDRVVCVEIDRGLIPLLGEALAEYGNVTVVEADFMELDLPAFIGERFGDLIEAGGSVSVCANLPYYITTPVIMKLVEGFPANEPLPFAAFTVMVQLEVARRLAAPAGSADYGSISASLALRCRTEKLFDVAPGNFLPAPKVSSAVVGIVPHGGIREVYPDAPADPEALLRFGTRVGDMIGLAFGQRRKTLVNALSGQYPKEKTAEALRSCGLREDIRGEKLSAEDFCHLADLLGR